MNDLDGYDYLIVGAGAAGTVMAARLSEDPSCRVLLLEAGPDNRDETALPPELQMSYGRGRRVHGLDTHDWNYQARVTELSTIHMPRGKVVGGSSTINGQIFLRPEPADLDAWSDEGLTRWSFAETLPFFRASENDLDFSGPYHGSGGPISVRRFPEPTWTPDQRAFYEAGRAHGHPDCSDHNAPGAAGIGATPLNDVGGVRCSTLTGYLNPCRRRANLRVVADAHVHRVLLSAGAATGVAVEVGGRLRHVFAGEVVLAAGALASPHLLMLSGIGPAGRLRDLGLYVHANLPAVGRNLVDHMTCELHWWLDSQFEVDDSCHPHQVVVRYTSPGSPWTNDMIIYAAARRFDETFAMRPTVNRPSSCGKVTLASADPYDHPLLDFRYYSEPIDLDRPARERAALCRIGRSARSRQDPRGSDYAEYFDPPVRPRTEPLDSPPRDDRIPSFWYLPDGQRCRRERR